MQTSEKKSRKSVEPQNEQDNHKTKSGKLGQNQEINKQTCSWWEQWEARWNRKTKL